MPLTRFSIDPTDPCFIGEEIVAGSIDVYLNGKKVTDCVMADSCQGVVEFYAKTAFGLFHSLGDSLLTEKYLGDVRIIDRRGRQGKLYQR